MVCKFPTWMWAGLILMIGAEGSGPYRVVRDGVCPYAFSRSSLPYLAKRKSGDARLPATHEARTKRNVSTTLLFEADAQLNYSHN